MASINDYIRGLQADYAKNNLYSQLGSGLLGADVNIKGGSPWTNLATNFVKGLLGGGLNEYGQVQNQEYNTGLRSVLEDTLTGAPIRAVDGLSNNEVQDVANSLSIFKQSALEDNKLAGLLKQSENKGAMLGQLEAQNEVFGFKPKSGEMLGTQEGVPSLEDAELLSQLHPDSPQYKSLKDRLALKTAEQTRIASDEDKLRGEIGRLPSVIQTLQSNKALAGLDAVKDLDSKSSDLPFIYSLITGLDGGVVKEGEYNIVQGSNPLLQQYKGTFEAALNGKSVLTPQLKRQIVDELKLSAASTKIQALKDMEPSFQTGLRRSANIRNLLPIEVDLQSLAKSYPPTQAGRVAFEQRARQLGLID